MLSAVRPYYVELLITTADANDSELMHVDGLKVLT